MDKITYITTIAAISKLPEGINFPLGKIVVGSTTLEQIVKKERLEKNMKYYELSLNDDEKAYVLIFKFFGAYIDSKLEQLGRLYGFPRGFPILYIPSTEYFHVFGFYPKFANDDRQQRVENSVFANGSYLSGSIKISGFLGGILPFIHGGQTYALFASKNSIEQGDIGTSGKSYVRGVMNISNEYISEEALRNLAETRAHLYGEFVADFDIAHGQPLPFDEQHPNGKNSMVCTMIAFGQTSNPQTNSPTDRFIRYMTGDEINDFCRRFNIPRVGQFNISGKENISSFMTELESVRDTMTYSKLVHIFSNHGVTVVDIRLTHDMIYATDIIEGLVLNIDGTIIKYKFPGYTMRTMFVRSAIQKGLVGEAITENAQQFVSRWVITPAQRSIYLQKCIAAMNLINSNSLTNQSEFATETAIHIMACEAVDKMTFEQVDNSVETTSSSGSVNIILVNGIIGSGKTTLMNKLAEIIPNSKAIDGDSLFPEINSAKSSSLTMTLGQERNYYTRSLILGAIMSNKIPIISTGGGVFCENDGSCMIIRMINEAFGLDVNLIQIVVDQSFEQIVEVVEKTFPFYTSENATTSVSKVITERVQDGRWTLPKGVTLQKFVSDISTRSAANQRFAEGIARSATHTFGIHAITSESRQQFIDSTPDFNIVTSALVEQTVPKSIKLTQLRFLTECDFGSGAHVGHITIAYNRNGMTYTLQDLAAINFKLPFQEKFPALKITVPASNPKKNIVFASPAIPSVHSDGSDHMTINSGIHEASRVKNVSLAVYQKESTITLDADTKNSATYDLTRRVVENCTMTNYGVFGIV